ncbi:MAG: DNA polymerase IV [Actinobacteria bacterium]|nr:DNA polymerase IV [Actinomycetota bacterium]
MGARAALGVAARAVGSRATPRLSLRRPGCVARRARGSAGHGVNPAPGAGTLTLLHVDLDAFYASVEQHADPALRGRPVVVGGLGPRGVVAAASYEARRFGIHSAMPMARARRACPHAIFMSPRFDAYAAASRQVMGILRDVTPLVEPLALDEAFLDVGGARRLEGDAAKIGASIRRRVRDETGLVASVGVATTKLVAKLASDLAKPDGMLVVEPGHELGLLHPLPVERLWGVGPATRSRLARFGVVTVGDLAATPEETLVRALGAASGSQLHALAWNRDDRRVEPNQETKSIGHEETFPSDVNDRATLERELLRMGDRVAARLRAAARVGRTVVLKARYGDFRTVTRSRTLTTPTDLAAVISRTAIDLLRGLDVGDGLRLLGVSVQQLGTAVAQSAQQQLSFEDAHSTAPLPRRELEHAVDRVRARFGDDAVGSAALVGPRGLRTGRRGTPWGPDSSEEPT